MDILQQIASVFAVIALLGASLWWLRRRGMAQFGVLKKRSGGKRSLETIERLALGPQHYLQLVRFADRVILIAVSPGSCSVIETFDWQQYESAKAGRWREPRPGVAG